MIPLCAIHSLNGLIVPLDRRHILICGIHGKGFFPVDVFRLLHAHDTTATNLHLAELDTTFNKRCKTIRIFCCFLLDNGCAFCKACILHPKRSHFCDSIGLHLEGLTCVLLVFTHNLLKRRTHGHSLLLMHGNTFYARRIHPTACRGGSCHFPRRFLGLLPVADTHIGAKSLHSVVPFDRTGTVDITMSHCPDNIGGKAAATLHR